VNDFAPLKAPHDGSQAAFHSMIVQRIYHEDSLFAQRAYVLLAVHAFLIYALTVLATGRESPLTLLIAIALTLFGALLGIFQASFGRQTSRAIGFWREYLRLVEERWEIPFDHLQYDFYADAKVETPFGMITKKRDNQKALYHLFKRTRYFTSMVTMIGLIFPVGLALFWALSFGYVLYQFSKSYCVSLLAFAILLLVGAAALRPSLAQAKGFASRVDARSD
jgi:hypothetical protein